MSIELMSKVWKCENLQDSTATFVLVALADWANDDGVCWPKIPALAHKCRLSERGVQKVIERLESAGYLTTKKNVGKGNANVFLVHPERGVLLQKGSEKSPEKPAENEAKEAVQMVNRVHQKHFQMVNRVPQMVNAVPPNGERGSSPSKDTPNDTLKDTVHTPREDSNWPDENDGLMNAVFLALGDNARCRYRLRTMPLKDRQFIESSVEVLRMQNFTPADVQTVNASFTAYLQNKTGKAQVNSPSFNQFFADFDKVLQFSRNPPPPKPAPQNAAPRYQTAAEKRAENYATISAMIERDAIAGGLMPASAARFGGAQ